MSYQVRFTETTNPAKPSIVVDDQSRNTDTSLVFVGKNYAGYAQPVAENFLHLLENFASNSPPSNPVQGQLWYDNRSTVNLLKVFDGTQWTSAGSIKKSPSAPTVNLPGDLWVDTSSNQLYLYAGSSWILVGPQFSDGTKTGPIIDTIVDTTEASHTVVSLYAQNDRLVIVSDDTFVPKSSIPGFPTIYKGVNLTSIRANVSDVGSKFWGVSEKAEALIVDGKTISAANFLRGDVATTANYPIYVRANGGITIGADLSFSVSTDENFTTFYSNTVGKGINFSLNNPGNPLVAGQYTVLHVNASAKVGIGPNNTQPIATLDVKGNVRTDGAVSVEDVTNANNVGEGSLSTQGGFSVGLDSYFGGSVNTFGSVVLNNVTSEGAPTAGAVILPGYTTSINNPPLYDIGSPTKKFRTIYANTFSGSFTGTITASEVIEGSVSGSASRLASPTTFNLEGDVDSSDLVFTGQTLQGTATFSTTLNSKAIIDKEIVSDSLGTDKILIYRENAGLKQTSKAAFVASVPTVPVGALFPFAGTIPPNGYLLCDGSEVKISDYPELFSIVKYSFKATGALVGVNTFAVPDLRGRFPLGMDSMSNDLTVPSKLTPGINVTAGGGPANRVTSPTADVVGLSSGSESEVLDVSNVPQHRHTLNNGTAQYYAIGQPGIYSDPSGISLPGPATTSTGLSFPNTGDVISTSTGQPVNVMNPYLTLNYIIFTGVMQ